MYELPAQQSLINLNRVDQPVCLAKYLGVLLHVFLAGRYARLRRAIRPISPGFATCFRAAESGIKVDRLWREVAIDITVSVLALKARSGLAPAAWVWCSVRDIRWDGVSREEVDVDIVARPVHCINSTSIVIHGRTIAAFQSNDTASDITTAIITILIASTCLSVGRRGE